MISVNGMAHIVINVSKWIVCKPFYKDNAFLGLEQSFDGDSISIWWYLAEPIGVNAI